jgi:parvulin-like peptidyl-prolyl isomerase
MSKNPPKSQANLSRKHQDRLHREQTQTRWIIIVSVVVLVLVVAIIGYGILEQRYFRWQRAVAIVNGQKISANEFRAFTKYYRNSLIQQADRTFQLASMFSGDPNAMSSFGEQLVQLSDELETFRAGNQALDQLINDKIIRQQAEERGITISPEDLEKAVQEALQYYTEGTPTPTPTFAPDPTSTLSATQLAMIPPTPTTAPTEAITATEGTTTTEPISATLTVEPTLEPTQVITQTPTPRPTATPFTFEAYQGAYATLIANLETIEIPEETIRYVIESRLIQQKLQEQVIGSVDCTDEQVWAQHILVADESLAKEIRQRLEDGEDWSSLAAEYSTDSSNKDQGGDLGWFGKGRMVAEFEEAAFSLTEPGQISEPVKSQFGWHIIRLVGRENRPLSASECSQLPDQKFAEWVQGIRDSSEVEIKDFWQEIVPLNPTLSSDIQQAVQGLRGAQIPSQLPTPAP